MPVHGKTIFLNRPTRFSRQKGCTPFVGYSKSRRENFAGLFFWCKMKCKKHQWEWLYFKTPETDKVGWIVANLTPGGGLSPKDDCVCVNCGVIGWRRKSRYGNFSVYQNQCKAFLQAIELADRLKLAFPTHKLS